MLQKAQSLYGHSVRGNYLVIMLMFLPWAGFWKVDKPAPPFSIQIGILLGVGLEGLHLTFVYMTFNNNDLAANTIGLLLGSFFLKICIVYKNEDSLIWISHIKYT